MPTECEKAIAKLQHEINEWVESILPSDYPTSFPPPHAEKVIREAVLGYQVLKPHEYIIIDSPIVQRLRYVHQTALAYLVYPTATHTRFDHSLGVARIAEQVGCSLHLEATEIETLRMAAILHDVGHSIFSHISEGLIQNKFEDTFDKIKEDPLFSDCKAHEILSYFIVRSERVRKLLEKVFAFYGKNIDIDMMSGLIIGKPAKLKLKAYMGDIIHGPFDADKLDYLVRDCFFTGIRADIDVERIQIACELLDSRKFKGFPNANLVVRKAGVSNLEQVVLNKVLMFSAIYHHHKVRALECMAKAVFETIWENPGKISNPKFKFERVSDFFKISEYDFFSIGLSEPVIASQIQAIVDRNLLKRCLIISPNLIEKSPQFEEHDLYKLGEEYPDRVRKLREYIWEEVPKASRTSIHDLWVDIPDPPNIDEDVDRCWVDVGTSKLRRLRDFLPYGEWLDAYEANKWQGHVFYVCDVKCRKAVNRAAKRVFKELWQLEFAPAATDDCKFM
jgi:HD superfamily phosphohydrolase